MAKVTACKMDVITKKSGHQMTGMAVSVCLTPAAPSPLPIPYPTMGTVAEGILDPCMRTKINGAIVLTVGSCMSKCHGNEPGTLKEVVSLNTAGPCFPALGAPLVIMELGMAGITGSIGQMNKSITVGASGSASGAGGGAGGGGGGGGGGSGPSGGSTQGPSQGGGGGGGDSEGAAPPDAPAPPGAEGQASGGHPIDVVTGAMFGVPADDFRLFGPSTLQWVRFYRTSSVRRHCGIGWGWSHSYSWRAEVRSEGIEVIDDQGSTVIFANAMGSDVVLAPFGRRLWWEGADLVLASDDNERRVLRQHRRGVYRLAEVRDRNGNAIEVEWEDGAVCRLTDSVGRSIEREKLPNGERWYYRLEASDGREHQVHAVSYELDERGDLVRVIDEGGALTEYRYDADHFLIEERLPNGLVYHFRYEDGLDGKRRCVETWGELPGRDILGEIGHGQRLAPLDVRGLYHTRLSYDPDARNTTLIDAAGGTHRYEGNEHGLVTRYVDPMGRTSTYRYDQLARLVAFTDGLGNRRITQYDALGRPRGCVSPLGHAYRFIRDDAGNVTTLEVPGGYRWHMKHDAAGRIVERTNPLGVTETCAYDDRGRVAAYTSANGTETRSYDAHGNVVAITDPAGTTTRYAYDALGRPVRVEGPDQKRRYDIGYDSYGHAVEVAGPCEGRLEVDASPDHLALGEDYVGKRVEYQYVGSVLVAVTRPNGSEFRIGHDAMGRIHWVENPAGERYRLEYDKSGLVVRESNFAGLEYRYEYDAAGQLVRRTLPSGAWQRFHRDAGGWVIEVERSDGRVDRFERDPRGYVTRASNAVSSITLERDGLGRVTREVQSTGGWEFVAEHIVDPLQPGEVHRYSSGWSVTIHRGLYSSLRRMVIQEGDERPSEVIDFEHDERFMEVARRRFGRSDAITTERDVLGRPTSITVTGDNGDVLRRRDYQWSRFGLLRMSDEHGASRTYELDDLGRPSSVQGAGVREKFSYSDHGTPIAEGASVTLGPGGRITRIDDTQYQWDRAGRLVARDTGRPSSSWRFEYDADNRIEKAIRGDGYEVRYLYDPFGRRLASVGNDGRSTWFGWDASALVEEQAGDRTTRRIYDDADEYTPIAESAGARKWRLVAADMVGTPWFYLGREGDHAELELTTWGRVAQSRGEPGPLRLAGQRADEATGLHYNRHRFYVPEIAQYATPDPIVNLNLQDVGFVSNPTIYIDPFGLVIIMGMRKDQVESDAELRSARDARQREGEEVIYANELYNKNTGQGRRLDNLPPGERVEVISHGAAGGVRFGRDVENGQQVGDRLVNAGLQGGQPVTVIACNSGTTPNADHPDACRKNPSGQSVVNGIHQATGGANPVTGVSANPGTTAGSMAGVAIVRPGVPDGAPHQRPHAPGPGPGREDGTVDIRDGHWVRAEGGQPAQQVPVPEGMGDPGPGR